ncbi:FG-GAP-like repeat-containing protein [Streptomyces sp. NPDC035033]|uniref:FG-GAP-like repeat-containing protein n=1 Tax=Streptomyces sp. NPDC035033 TaxID=3155368 RepID=UPI0033C186F8
MSVRRAVALALSAALGLTGLAGVTAPAALAASTSPYEVTIPAPPSATPPYQQLFGAGTGVQTTDPATGRLRWQSLADGRVELRDFCDSSDRLAYFGDRVGCVGHHGDAAEASVYDFATGTVLTRARPEGHTWLRAFDAHRMLAYRADAEGAVTLSLLGLGEGAPADADVTTDERITGRPEVLAFDGAGAVVRYTRADQSTAVGLLDFAAARLEPLSAGPALPGTLKAALSGDRIALYGDYGTDRAYVVPRAVPSAPGKTVTVPGASYGEGRLALLGDWLVGHVGDPYAQRRLKAVSLETGAVQDLGVLAATAVDLRRAPNDSLYVVGGTDSSHWGVRRVTLDAATGAPVTAQVLSTPPKPVQRTGLTLANGHLTTEHTDDPKRELVRYDLSLTEPRTATRRWSCDAVSGTAANCPPTTTTREIISTRWIDTGDGRLVTLLTEDLPAFRTEPPCSGCVIKVQVTTTGAGGTTRTVQLDTTRRLSPRVLLGASGRHLHFLATENYETRSVVADIETGKVLSVSAGANQSLWGTWLWSASTANDTVSAVDVRTGATVATADLGIDCGIVEFNVLGKWMYGRCGTTAVVHDRETKKSVRFQVGSGGGRAILGDGFLVKTSYAAEGDQVQVIDVRSGTAVTRTLGSMPSGVTNYNQTWTVDRFGGAVAFVDAQQAIRVAGLGGTTSRATVTDSSVSTSVNIKSAPWKPRWWVSKPVLWTLTLKNKANGKVVRTLTGEGRGVVAPAWDGKDASGKYVANGAHTWTLTAKPADGQGADLTASGALAVSGAAAVRRDMAGDDGFGDLLVMDTTGATSLYRGTGTGGVSARIAGSGTKFPTTALFAPVGDLNGDRCADVYARVGDQLRAYRPGCGKVLTASSPYTLVGSGWGGYDVLTSSGDVNGDGYADLVARQASTGDVYFYGGTATHALKARVRIGANWKLYKKIVGAGDLNGDGRGDLLGLDSAGVLWRYYGTSTGGVTARVKVGGGWGGYSALVGVGDLSGDGKADLLARDTAGKLWRYASTGAGAYGTRVLIGSSGWNGFKGLF